MNSLEFYAVPIFINVFRHLCLFSKPCAFLQTHTHLRYLSLTSSISSSLDLQLMSLPQSQFNPWLYSFIYSFIGNFQLIWDSIKSQRAVMQTENNFHYLDAPMTFFFFFSCLELFYSVFPTLEFPFSHSVPEEGLHIITHYLTNGRGVASQVSTQSFILKCQHVCYSHFFFGSTTAPAVSPRLALFVPYFKYMHIYLHMFIISHF